MKRTPQQISEAMTLDALKKEFWENHPTLPKAKKIGPGYGYIGRPRYHSIVRWYWDDFLESKDLGDSHYALD